MMNVQQREFGERKGDILFCSRNHNKLNVPFSHWYNNSQSATAAAPRPVTMNPPRLTMSPPLLSPWSRLRLAVLTSLLAGLTTVGCKPPAPVGPDATLAPGQEKGTFYFPLASGEKVECPLLPLPPFPSPRVYRRRTNQGDGYESSVPFSKPFNGGIADLRRSRRMEGRWPDDNALEASHRSSRRTGGRGIREVARLPLPQECPPAPSPYK